MTPTRRHRSLCRRFGHCRVFLVTGGWTFDLVSQPMRRYRYWTCARCREKVHKPKRDWRIHGRVTMSAAMRRMIANIDKLSETAPVRL